MAITSCPVRMASCFKILCDRTKLKVSYNALLKAEELKDFKSLMVVMGGSAKGLGEAGIDEAKSWRE